MTGLGDCYKAAGNLLIEIRVGLNRDYDRDSVRLVHALVSGQGPVEGVRFGHAWIEHTDADGVVWAVDRSNGRDIRLPAVLYRAIGNVRPEEAHEYAVDAAAERLLSAGHYGPWE